MRKIDLSGIAENGERIELTPFDVKVFHGASSVLKCTDEGNFITTEIFPVNGWEETPEMRERVNYSLRKIDAAGQLVIPEFHEGSEREEDESRTTWNGLDAEAMAAMLDDLRGSGALDDDMLDEWRRMRGLTDDCKAHTTRDRVTLAKNHVLQAIDELERAGVSCLGNTRISGIMRGLEELEAKLADELEDYELGNIRARSAFAEAVTR